MKNAEFSFLGAAKELGIAGAMMSCFYFANMWMLKLLEVFGEGWPTAMKVVLAGGTCLGLILLMAVISYRREKRLHFVCG